MPAPTSPAEVKQPFAEQLAAIRLRTENLIPTARWTDVLRNGHDRGFAVAGAMKADLLAEFAGAIERVAAEGKSIEWFREHFDQIVERHGWSYTGERNWRTRVIYTTNMRTSYAAGRLAQLRDPELQQAAPYWMYRHGGSADPRPQHLAWDRLVLPADDPWWKTHYPPNGWGCSCYVVAVSKATAERLGGRFEDPPARDPKGAIDAGWDYMPGDTVTADIRAAVAEKLSAQPFAVASALLPALNAEAADVGLFGAWRAHPDGDWPLVRLPDDDALAIGARSRVGKLSADTMRKQDRAHPEITDAEYAAAQDVITRHTNKARDGRAMIYIREVTDDRSGGYVLVVKTTVTGEGTWVQSYRRLSRDQAKRDTEVKRLLDKGK